MLFGSRSVFLVPVILAVTGCASIMSGTTQTVSFQSSPEGATVTVNGRIIGKTPISTALKKEKGQTLIFSLDGHKPVTLQLTTSLDPWFWGNIVLGGFIGSTTDGLNGAVNHYTPSQYYVTLTPDAKGSDDKTSRSRDHQIRDYVVFRHSAILRELTTGSSQCEGFSSLTKRLDIPSAQRDSAWTEISTLARQTEDPVQFADAMIARYRKQP